MADYDYRERGERENQRKISIQACITEYIVYTLYFYITELVTSLEDSTLANSNHLTENNSCTR